VYQGLAGLFLVTDDEETAAGLPAGEYDVPLIIQDRTFDPDNQLVYLPGGMMDQMMGLLGDQILVNGQPDFALPVATRAYRLRLLNGSNSRIYKLGWSDKTPLTVIATDGGLLEAPVERDYVTLGPGERIELWADFTGGPLGAEVKLQSLAFIGAEGDELAPGGGMHGHMQNMMMSAAALPNGQPFDVLTVRIEREEKETLTKPTGLAALTRYNLEDAINAANPRSYSLTFRQMVWLLNDRQFEMDGTADNEIVRLNDLEVWEFVNELNPGQMMETLGMAHPMHIHGVQFQVLSREVLPEVAAGVESVREGYVDGGWKDTILLMPGERVKLLLKFSDYPGLYLYHCHNLEHEDQGMMRNYRVET
jgi:FtsP/CotA-like multicopper oxidase with cupredoxin domain